MNCPWMPTKLRRVTLNLPDRLAAIVEQRSEGSDLSESQIICELAQFGHTMSAFRLDDIVQWQQDETTLLKAAKLAINYLNAPAPEDRERAGREIAEIVLQRGLRREPAALVAAEDAASYGLAQLGKAALAAKSGPVPRGEAKPAVRK